MMNEVNTVSFEESIKLNSILCHPLKPDYWQEFSHSWVLYLESDYYPLLNKAITKRLEEITKIYRNCGKTFVYLPSLVKQDANIFEYDFPGMTLDQEITPENITTRVTAKLLAEFGITQPLEEPMLFACLWNEADDSIEFVMTRVQGQVSVKDFFLTHARSCDRSVPRGEDFRACRTPYLYNYNDPDERFEGEVERIVSEIDERINRLKDMGLYRLLTDTVAPMLTPQLSSLCVTEDFRIFLPDYNNMEIKMNPLSKAVYFLFLRHPEGIFLRDLPLYRNELNRIYMLLSNRENPEEMDESIRKLTDLSDNSIYEKCSRIKRSFLELFGDSLAKKYYITNPFGECKRVDIAQLSLVLPEALKNIPMSRKV